MSLHDPKLTLQQMREYAVAAQEMAASTTPEAMRRDRRTRLALERAVSVIGEAAARPTWIFHTFGRRGAGQLAGSTAMRPDRTLSPQRGEGWGEG